MARRNRTSLKEFFLKGKIPTQDHFGDLIDSALNQEDDGVAAVQGKLGIGVSAPTEKLEVNGNVKASGTLSVMGLTTTSEGRVGIGTSAPVAKLEITGNLKVRSADGTATFGLSDLCDLEVNGGSDGVFWLKNTSAVANARTSIVKSVPGSDGELLSVLNSGNVGIGTEAPTEKLEVNGNIKARGTLSVMGLTTTSEGPVGVGLGGGQGRVGIGTAAPTEKLEVNGNVKAKRILLGPADRSRVGQRLSVSAQDEHGGVVLTCHSSGSVLYRPHLDFSTARGTSANPVSLQAGDFLGTIAWRGETGSGLADAAWVNAAVDGTPVAGRATVPGRLEFHTAESGTGSLPIERMRITSSGNVGIGTAAPTEKLEVNGNIKAGGTLSVMGLTTTSEGRVGIGTAAPTEKLEVNGNIKAGPSATLEVNGRVKVVVPAGADGAHKGIWVSKSSDANFGIGLYTGTEDGASMENYNGALASWWGIGFRCTCDNRTRIVFNTRDGSATFAGVVTASEHRTSSDARLKRVLGPSFSGKDLATLQQLRVTDFQWIDPRKDGGRPHKLLIAQEVQEIYPLAVSTAPSPEAIPNVHAEALASVYEPATGTLAITTPTPHDLAPGDEVEMRVDGEPQRRFTVTSVPTPHVFQVSRTTAATSVFVYGKVVNDLLTLNYDAIAMLNVSATQELARLVESLKERVHALERAR